MHSITVIVRESPSYKWDSLENASFHKLRAAASLNFHMVLRTELVQNDAQAPDLEQDTLFAATFSQGLKALQRPKPQQVRKAAGGICIMVGNEWLSGC